MNLTTILIYNDSIQKHAMYLRVVYGIVAIDQYKSVQSVREHRPFVCFLRPYGKKNVDSSPPCRIL